MIQSKTDRIYTELSRMFPNARCELIYKDIFQLLVVVSLSAQTTDKRVNIVSPKLFEKYPTSKLMSVAKYEDVKEIIKSLGLSSTKARNIIQLSKEIESKFNGRVPTTREELKTLRGVGQKTANVVLSEGYSQPAIAVDTHVKRVSKRLGLTLHDDPIKVEEDLKKEFEENRWSQLHHYLIFFGRYVCHAKKPECDLCRFLDICQRDKLKGE